MSESNGHATATDKAQPSASTKEIGETGLQVSGGLVQDEFHRALRGPRGAKIWREMSDNDDTVGALLFAITMVIRELNWHVAPADENNPQAVEIADRFWGALNDMSFSWPQTVDAILTFLPYGWSLFETVLKVCRGWDVPEGDAESAFDDGFIGWRKLAFRAQESRQRWVFDDEGGLQQFVQKIQGKPDVPIPIDACLLFRTTTAKGNPEGRSILRTAWRSWRNKKYIEDNEATGIQRDLVGLPKGYMLPEYLDTNAPPDKAAVRAEFEKILGNLHRDEQEYVLLPWKMTDTGPQKIYDIELMTTGGQRQFDTNLIIARYNMGILRTVLADVLMIGQQRAGSFAMVETRNDMFNNGLTAFADEVASVVNQYGFPRLMKLNALPMELTPILTHPPLGKRDLASLAQVLTALFGGGMVLDQVLEDAVRDLADLPPADIENADL